MNLDLDLLFSNPLYAGKKRLRNHVRCYGSEICGRTLDLGCGRKPFRNFISSDTYFGMEYSISLHPDIVGDVVHLPFADESFDSLLCTEVLEHVPEPKLVISEMFRVSRKGGKGYITMLVMWYLHYEPPDYYRYTKYGISYLFREGGFEIIVIEKNGGLVQFLTTRMVEEFFTWFHRACFPIRFNPHLRERVALVLFVPLSFILWALTELLDNFSKRDVLDWSMLVRKPMNFKSYGIS